MRSELFFAHVEASKILSNDFLLPHSPWCARPIAHAHGAVSLRVAPLCTVRNARGHQVCRYGSCPTMSSRVACVHGARNCRIWVPDPDFASTILSRSGPLPGFAAVKAVFRSVEFPDETLTQFFHHVYTPLIDLLFARSCNGVVSVLLKILFLQLVTR